MKIQKIFPWSLGAVIGLLGISLFHPEWHMEFAVFREPDRVLMYPYYAYWVFEFFKRLPEPVGYLIWSLLTIGAMYFGIRSFGGKHWYVFSSFTFLWLLLFGQSDGLVAVGIVIAWVALQKEKPVWLGLGLIIASIKPMTAGLLLLLWWWSPSRWKSLIIPLIVLGLSFIQWGFWIPEWLRILVSYRGNMQRVAWNYSLWPVFGFAIWLIWPLVLAVPLERTRKLMAVGAVSMLTVPYFPFYSALILYCMPIPFFFYALSQLFLLGPQVTAWMRWLPVALLIWCIWPFVKIKITSLSKKASGKEPGESAPLELPGENIS